MKSLKSLLCGALIATAAFSASAATFIGNRNDFRDETIYFAMTTRFYDGDPGNNTYCWDGKLNVNDPEWRGDFKGLIQKLDYIKALGFTTVWITPVVENASGLDYHGYHAFNFSKVDPRYESSDCKFQDLIDAAHKKGMKIILDIVLNHTGNFGEENLCPMFVKDYTQNLSNINKSMKLHPNTKLPSSYDMDAQNSYQMRLAQMKNVDGVNHDTHNYWHHYGNFNWDDYSRWYGQIAGDCVDLNTENAAVANYLVDCYGKFIEMGVDGFRIDTSGHISRLTFNKMFIPRFTELAEKHKAKRNNGPFFMFGEVCARDRNVMYRGQPVLSPYFYTWKEDKDYAWDMSTTSWDNIVVMEGAKGSHTNITSQDKHAADYEKSFSKTSNNAMLNGNTYHTPDYSQYSNFSIIDFPMHWNFRSTQEAWSIKGGDNLYNDATYNVVYVDSHDYAPDGAPENQRFAGSQETWASNLDLMFTFRGIPCIYYGSEIEFKKGCVIDEGPNIALKNSGRAYFGGYIEGSANVTDFATYTNATGNMAATLSHPLALHIQRLNKIRAAIPALRKGQYSTSGCSGGGHGGIAFKRRFTDSTTDSYVLVAIGGAATFSSIENGTYIDAITGDTKTVTNGTLSTGAFSGSANMRIYVLSTSKTPAPGKIGEDGKYLYGTSAVNVAQKGYDGKEEPEDTKTVKDSASGGGSVVEPETPVTPSMQPGEQAIFFEDASGWGGTIKMWIWSGSKNYTGGSWPGQSAAYLGNKVWKWTYTGTDKIPADAQVIFSNGSTQTQDGTLYVNGGYYTQGGLQKVISGAGEIPDTPDTPDKPAGKTHYVIYYDNSKTNWNTVKAYVWYSESEKYAGDWPGTSTTKDSATGYYKYEFDSSRSESELKCIFNNGNSGNGNQTDDFELHNYGVYDKDSYKTTAVSTVVGDVDIDVWSHGGVLYVQSAEAANIVLYRVDGTSQMIHVEPGINAFDNLQRGFYILNRVKVAL